MNKGLKKMNRVYTVALMVMLLAGGQVLAGLATDPAAYNDGATTWSGSVAFADAGSAGLEGTIEYAVFAAGDFSYAGYTPTPGEFIYAYQIKATGSLPVSALLVTMLDSNEANNIGTFDLGGGIAPDSASFVGSVPNLGSAQWNWANDGLTSPGNSVGLVYSSINAPIMLFGTIQDGGAQAMAQLPSPSDVIPEPASMVLVGLGALAVIRRR